jgi:Uma2 family endonuclease
MYVGAPTLAVEILSPHNSYQARRAKLKSYMKYGVPMVWSIDPEEQTVTVYRPNADPIFFNRSQTISAEPELPGFTCPVADFFR